MIPPFDPAAAAEQFYGPLLDATCPARRVGWESEAAHLLRLRAIAEGLAPLAEVSHVLDIGCGEGRLIEVLSDAGYAGNYTGEDILAPMVERARVLHPEHRFLRCDAFSQGEIADAVVCSGTLNTPTGHDHQAAAEDALTALWERTGEVLIIDFAVRDRHPLGAELRTLELAGMWQRARSLTDLVCVREDLVAGEAMLTLRRSRRQVLEALLPEMEWAVGRARILLASRDPQGVRSTLAARRDEVGTLWRALADLVSGRARDAESALRPLLSHAEVGGRALLHLAVVLLATQRGAEAQEHLATAANGTGETADEARVMLAELALRAGDEAQAEAWARGIADPWMRREVLND